MNRRYFWPAALTILTAWQIDSVRRHDGSHLCAWIRPTLRLHTRPGRVAFLLSWAALTAWFVPHLLRIPEAIATAVDAFDSDRPTFDTEE